MRHRDHRATKVEQSLHWRKERKIDVESVIGERGRVYHAMSCGQFLFLTTGWYRYDLPPGRPVFLSDQHWRASASPWFFIGGVIRLEPREFPFLPFSPRFLSPRLTALLSSDVRIMYVELIGRGPIVTVFTTVVEPTSSFKPATIERSRIV